jgi:hypothetical protein
MIRPFDRALAAAVRLLVKAGRSERGDPDVEAIAALVYAAYRRRWREVSADAVQAMIDEVRALADELPTPDVDVLVAERDRQRILDAIVAALVLALEQRASAPPPASLAAVVRSASGRLAALGAQAAGLTLDPGLPDVQRALAAAERDLPLLVGGRVAAHQDEIEAVAEAMLTSRTARTPSTSGVASGVTSGVPALPGAPMTLQDAQMALAEALGADGGAWLADAVWAWAYRWNSVGAFLAAREAGVALYVWNNPPRGPDTRTTPFCRWVHGRRIAMGRASLQVDLYVRAVMMGDTDAAMRAWPLDLRPDRGGPERWALNYAQMGLPPYHWGCRDVLLALAPDAG